MNASMTNASRTDTVLDRHFRDTTVGDVADDPAIRALRDRRDDLLRQHAELAARVGELRAVTVALPGRIDSATRRVQEIEQQMPSIAADVLLAMRPEDDARKHEAELDEARTTLARLQVAAPVIEARLRGSLRPVVTAADRVAAVDRELATAIDAARMTLARSRL